MASGNFDPRNDVRPSTFEVICKICGPEVAYSFRQHLREASQCDEESYVYKDAMMAYVNAEAATKCEESVLIVREEVGKISEDQSRIFECLNVLTKSILLQKHVHHGETKQNSTLNNLDDNWSSWIISIALRCERLVARKPRWALCTFCALMVGQGALAFCLFTSWQNSERNITQQIRDSNYEEAGQWAGRQVEERFQNLEPQSYKLAQIFEQRARQVRLPDGRTAWQVCLSEDDGVIDVNTILQLGGPTYYPINMLYEPDRLALSKTAPSPTPSATKGSNANHH